MPTKLTRPISRVTHELVRDTGKSRRLVATLYPSGMIGLRPQGTRREETYPIGKVYMDAIKARVERERREKAAKRKARKG